MIIFCTILKEFLLCTFYPAKYLYKVVIFLIHLITLYRSYTEFVIKCDKLS